jgi:hypothetical protein
VITWAERLGPADPPAGPPPCPPGDLIMIIDLTIWDSESTPVDGLAR